MLSLLHGRGSCSLHFGPRPTGLPLSMLDSRKVAKSQRSSLQIFPSRPRSFQPRLLKRSVRLPRRHVPRYFADGRKGGPAGHSGAPGGISRLAAVLSPVISIGETTPGGGGGGTTTALWIYPDGSQVPRT